MDSDLDSIYSHLNSADSSPLSLYSVSEPHYLDMSGRSGKQVSMSPLNDRLEPKLEMSSSSSNDEFTESEFESDIEDFEVIEVRDSLHFQHGKLRKIRITVENGQMVEEEEDEDELNYLNNESLLALIANKVPSENLPRLSHELEKIADNYNRLVRNNVNSDELVIRKQNELFNRYLLVILNNIGENVS